MDRNNRGRKPRRKVCAFCVDKVENIDYKTIGKYSRKAVSYTHLYGKQSERWLMGYNKRPKDFSQIDHVVDLYESMGVDRLATWTYRGGYGTSVAAKDPLELWDRIGENYNRVLKK